MPASAKVTPNSVIASDFAKEPLDSTIATISPSTISEKYSGAPKLSANFPIGMATAATISVPTVPAKNEPIAAMASAAPASPLRAIW